MPAWEDAPEVVAAAPAARAPAWESAPLASEPAAPDMSAVGSMIRGNLGAKVPAPETAHDFLGALEAGLQVSVTGLLARGKAPSIQADPNAPWYNRAAGNVAQMAGDVPAMIGGAVLGAGAGAPTGPGAVITGTAGAFALPAGLRATLMDAYTKGDFKSFGDFWDRASGIMWETTKAWVTGAATGAAGKIASTALPAATPVVAKVVAPTAAEITAMVTVGKALEGHAPTAQDFMDAAIVLAGVKGATTLAPKLRDIYSATGKQPAEVVADAKADVSIAQDLGTPSSQTGAKLDWENADQAIYHILNDKGEPVGSMQMLKRGDALQVHNVGIDVPEAMGKGYGVKAYSEVVDSALAQGKTVWSDSDVSADANRVYDALARRGYTVERNDKTTITTGEDGTLHAARGPVYKITGKAEPAADAIPAAYAPLAAAERGRAIVPGEKAQAVAESPFADLPQAPGEPAKPTHVNYNLLNSSEDAASALSRLSTIYEQEIQTQRRGTVGWEQTSTEAAKMLSDTLGGVDATLLMPREPGTPAGAAEILARKQLTIGAAEDMARQAREYQAKGTAVSPEDTVSFLASIERAAMIQQEFLGARAEAGRALNILKSTARDAERVKQIQDVMQMYGGEPAMLAKMIGSMENPVNALKFARDAVKATTWEKFVEAWKAGILSGYVTHVANVMGNGVFAALRVPIDAVASGFGALRGGKDRVSAMEPVGRLIGDLQGGLDGLRVGFHVLRDGADLGGKTEQHRTAISGLKGEIVRLPFRLLSAEDAVFRTMNERGEAYSLAIREASREGLNPLSREFRERVASVVQNPSPEMAEAITKAGERFTFNSELGGFGKNVKQLVDAKWFGTQIAPLQIIVPFLRTPLNILKELSRMTPLAPLLPEWVADIKIGGAARDKALAEMTVGTAAMAAVVMYTLDGKITGAGNPDPAKKRVQLAAGWQPYSIKVGDTYYSYNRLQPIGTLMGLAVDMAETWDQMGDEENTQTAKMLAVAFSNAITNQTFLQGITNVVNTLSDPGRYGVNFVKSFARSAVPNIVGQTAEMTDPFMRETDSLLDVIKSRIPAYRQELLVKRDLYGEPIANKERLFGISPVTTTTDTEDKVRSEAARLNISGGDAPKKVHVGRGSGKLGDVPLTPEQRDVFNDVAGHLAHDVLTKIVNSSSWDTLPDAVQKKAFAKVFLQAHRAGAAAALPPELRAGIAQEITQKIEAQLAPETE